MITRINSTVYNFHKSFQNDEELRKSLNTLAGKTFGGLSFEKWYQKGFWTEKCVPYALFNGSECVANILSSRFKVSVHNEEKTYIQLGTVMTDPAYRGMGLSRYLMQEIFSDWKDNCDAIYLYANDRVVDFYPKFSFTKEYEYQYSTAVSSKGGNVKKLNIENPADCNILLGTIQYGNPFTAVKMPDSVEFVMFHCVMFHKDNLYYLPEYDAVAVAEQYENTLLCYDIFCKEDNKMEDILSVLANKNCCKVYFGFTPRDICHCDVHLLQEEDTHLFVLPKKDNIFSNNKLMFPLLCRT